MKESITNDCNDSEARGEEYKELPFVLGIAVSAVGVNLESNSVKKEEYFLRIADS